jgi:hypothetical protein
MAGRFLRNEGSSANPAFMWCRRLELGAHQAWCPLLHALFKAANTLPALRTNATVSAITSGVFMADTRYNLAPESCHPLS